MQKAKEKYSKVKAAEYYKQNKETIKEKSREHYKTCHKKKKKYQVLVQYKKNNLFFIFFLI